jgi:hypothetical protein
MDSRVVTIPALVLALSSCSACGKKKEDTIVDNRPARRATLTWGIVAVAPRGEVPRNDVFLGVTDETGKAVSYPVGTYDGTCTVVGPIAEYQALTAVSCTYNEAGVQLHAAGNRNEVIVMRMDVKVGQTPDPLNRHEVTTIPIPLGAKIEAGAQ